MSSPHAVEVDALMRELRASPQGLSREEAERRLQIYGRNLLEEEKVSRLGVFLRQFKSFLVYILLAAAATSALLGKVRDFTIIALLVLANGFLGYWQEMKAESSIRALKKLSESKVKVLRDGTLVEAPSSELVPGDVVVLAEGDLVTADLRLIESSGLMIDESTLTGESIPVSKDHSVVLPADSMPYELRNMALAGTVVVKGSGKGLVARTGRNTYLASIAEKAKEKPPETPLNRAINSFVRRYVVFLVALLAGVGVVGMVQGRDIIEVAYLLVAELVSAVPEGLPIVVTFVLVVGALMLSKRKTLTRHLPAVETLGSATVIASDKTGTITEGRLRVNDVLALNPDKVKLVAALCNNSRGGIGDPIDVALANWVGAEYEELRKAHPRIKEYPFDVKRKFMATVNEVDGKPTLFVKGAFEALAAMAAADDDRLKELGGALNAMAERGLRVLAFGVGEWNGDDVSSWRIEIAGLVGFLDPPKSGVKEAVATAKKAGIKVIMITGDHPLTAKAVAKEVGIWSEGDLILTGRDVESMSDEELHVALNKATVLARVLPEHKHRVVKVLQERGEIVVVTGDGVNDVPALKIADLGIAMGSGTEAAKSAAKMIILDNNLKVIVDAIRNGRLIADNIRKAIYYLVSTCLGELTLISSAVLMGLPLPLYPTQILWINLVTEGVVDKAFPFTKEEGNVMERPPKKPERQFFDSAQAARILFFGLVMGLLNLLLFIHLLGVYDVETAVSIVFTSVVVVQWFNGLQAQKEREPFFMNLKGSLTINPYIPISVGAGLALQLIALYAVPEWFHAVPISMEGWGYVLLVSALAFTAVEVKKVSGLLLRRRRQRHERGSG
ncbi:MAG: cation-transporting P-type ATPase [Candidatus Nezhaarchaeota archaeon]|nr:cation-transporting P-type ATPase [Candidatus Nezhaarchaeota archaeon]